MNIFNIKTNYPCIRQHDMKDCGAACIATISKRYGLKLPISKIREVAGTDKRGTNVLGLIMAAEQLGFTAKGVKGDQEVFFNDFPLPAIAHVVVDGSLLHYVVIHRVTPNDIIVADPARGILKITPSEFFKQWTGVLILMVPTPQFKKGDHTAGVFSRFLLLLMPQKRLLTGIFIASLFFTVLVIMGAFYFKFLIDEIIPYELASTLTSISIGVIAIMIFKTILSAFRGYLLLKLSQKLDISLILGYYYHVLRLPMHFFDTRKTGEVLSRLMDATKVRDAVSSAALAIMIDCLMVAAGGVILYLQNGFLFAITALMIPIYIMIVWAFHRSFEQLNRKQAVRQGFNGLKQITSDICMFPHTKHVHAYHKAVKS